MPTWVCPPGFLTHRVALPPSAYSVIAQRLAEAGLEDNARLVVGKPFGHDLHSARPGAPHRYDTGSWGTAETDRLATDDRWLPLEQEGPGIAL